MRMTILGCGTSTGVPLIHCACSVCRSKNPKNHRLRASAWIQSHGKSILIDTSTDLRQQALRAKIPRIDAVLFTHPHADHIHGIDELRSFNFIQKSVIPVYGNAWTCAELNTKFSYIFQSGPVEGGGVPQLKTHLVDTQTPFVDVLGEHVIPISVSHGSKECVGYRLGPIAYITDCSLIPSSSMERLRNLSVLVLDCLRLQPHGTHLHLDQALAIIRALQPKRTFLTHLGHDFDYLKSRNKLPKDVFFAYDGLSIVANERGSI